MRRNRKTPSAHYRLPRHAIFRTSTIAQGRRKSLADPKFGPWRRLTTIAWWTCPVPLRRRCLRLPCVPQGPSGSQWRRRADQVKSLPFTVRGSPNRQCARSLVAYPLALVAKHCSSANDDSAYKPGTIHRPSATADRSPTTGYCTPATAHCLSATPYRQPVADH